MSSPVQSSPALVLRTRVYGESDKIVTFLTRDFGKVSGIAKGALRSKRRFVASLEPLTHVRLGFRIRNQSDLAWIESADIVRAPRNVTRDLDRYAYSTYVLELVDCMVEGQEAEAGIFDLAEELLRMIDTTHPAPLAPDALRYFEIRLLVLCGFEPRLECCARCGTTAAEAAPPLRFNPRTGTLACGHCGEGSGVAASAGSVAAISALRDRTLADIEGVPAGLATEVRILLQTFVNHHLRRPLRSPALLREILGH